MCFCPCISVSLYADLKNYEESYIYWVYCAAGLNLNWVVVHYETVENCKTSYIVMVSLVISTGMGWDGLGWALLKVVKERSRVSPTIWGGLSSGIAPPYKLFMISGLNLVSFGAWWVESYVIYAHCSCKQAFCIRRNANGAMQRNDETKPCKTRAKQTGFTCLLLYTVSSRRMEE